MVTIGVRGTQQWCIYNKLLEQNWIKTYQKRPHHGQGAELRCWQERANLLAQQIKKDVPLKRFTLKRLMDTIALSVREIRIPTSWRRKNVKWWRRLLRDTRKDGFKCEADKTHPKNGLSYGQRKQVSRTLGKLYVAKAESP